MKKLSIYTFVMLLITGIFTTVFPDIIRVPQDQETISRGLNRARAGDTVLVADGVYTGNGNVNLDIDSRVTLISENGPDNCMIDGQNNTRNAFTLDDRSVLSGFTIRRTTRSPLIFNNVDDWRVSNCIISDVSSENDSVGTKVLSSDGIFEYCIFRNLNGNKSGSALYIRGGDVELNYCYFINNTADSMGGAVFIFQSADVQITNCIFRDNETGIAHGGAIAMFGNGTDVNIDFSNFNNNTARNWGGAIYKDRNSRPIIRNSIFWGNSATVGDQLAGIIGNENRMISIINSIVEDGEDVEAGWFGIDLVEENARYTRGRNPTFGANNLYLHEESPGIDQGSDTAERLGMDNSTTQTSLEPDEDVVDIGYHYSLDFYYALGQLTGYVYDIEDEDPLDGALIASSLGQEARSNREGRWTINEAFADTTHSLTVTYPGYNDSTVIDIELAEGESVETNFSLYHPLFSIDPIRITADADSGDTGRVDLTIENSGNGPLEWTTELSLAGRQRNPWDFERFFNVGEAVDEARVSGVAFADQHYFVTGPAGDSANVIYKFDVEGEIVDTLLQFGYSRLGMNGLAYDGELLWGAEDDSIFGFTPDGELVTKWETTIGRGNAKFVTWDSDREILWQGSITTNISAADRDGNVAVEDEIPRDGLRIYGLAYFKDDPDDHPLYVLTRLSADDTGYIYKFDPETYHRMEAHNLRVPIGRVATGFISYDIDPYSVYFLCIAEAGDADGGDKIAMSFLDGNTSWMMLDNTEGVVNPNEETNLTMSLFSERFGYGQFNGNLTVFHNAVGGQIVIPIALNILDVPVDDDPFIPHTSEIQSVYPNPFNSIVTVNFLVSDHQPVTLTVFDISGRIVHSQLRIRYNIGLNQQSFDAANWGSGVYFVRLNTPAYSHAMKIICLK